MSIWTCQKEAKKKIQIAADWAQETEERKYVTYSDDGSKWVACACQPPHTQSHWMVLPNGDLFAHVETKNGDYHYEEVT